MSQNRLISQYCFVLLLLSVSCCLLCCVDVWASETTSGVFRSKYDTIMKWVNFFIIIALFFKYCRKPFRRFIRLQKGEIEKQIKTVEERRNLITLELEHAIVTSRENDKRLLKIKDRIISEGEQKYQEIIDEAQRQSKTMLENAQYKIDSHLSTAIKTIKDEIVDIAVTLAENKLPKFVDDNYNKILLSHYMKGLK